MSRPSSSHLQSVSQRFSSLTSDAPNEHIEAYGKLVRAVGGRLEVSGLKAGVGARCHIDRFGNTPLNAEVIGFEGERLLLACDDSTAGVVPGASVRIESASDQVLVGEALLGRVVDGAGRPLDGRPLVLDEGYPFRGKNLNPMDRFPISEPIDTGVRALNALLTVGRGQRIGLFAGSGVGKSTLLGMITRFSNADVVVVSLVGERGREVKEFVEESLGEDGLKRAVVVATPADTSPLMRVSGCWRASAIAEYYREKGLNVLLLMDSITRFAQAQRELSLSAGEPPVSKGYTPSVFSLIPGLIERAGIVGPGSITAIYTVLVEGDDLQDPIADLARASLDGHIVLSRQLADAGVFPAIDVEKSVSRSMLQVTKPEHQDRARMFRELFATYEQNKDLIALGAYRKGSDRLIDAAISHRDSMLSFLKQPLDKATKFESDLLALQDFAQAVGVAEEESNSNLSSQNVMSQPS
jgi:flagellum-specific ATP synthase